MANKILVVTFVFGCSLAGVISTRACYQCNSYNDKNHSACVDPMSPYPYVNYTYCPDSYVCTRVSYITQKQLVVSRGCDLSGNTCQNIYNSLSRYYPDISTFNCYTCTANYCNSASGFAHSGHLNEELEGFDEGIEPAVYNI